MLRYTNILDAVNILNGWLSIENVESPTTKQLVGSLQVYKRRGEFDGTIQSAYQCLWLAGYELERI